MLFCAPVLTDCYVCGEPQAGPSPGIYNPMSTPVDVRESARDDWAEIELLYPAAFPEEDLLPLKQQGCAIFR